MRDRWGGHAVGYNLKDMHIISNEPRTSVEKPSYDVAKKFVLAWKPDATNMEPQLKNGGIGSHICGILCADGVPRRQATTIIAHLAACNVRCMLGTFHATEKN